MLMPLKFQWHHESIIEVTKCHLRHAHIVVHIYQFTVFGYEKKMRRKKVEGKNNGKWDDFFKLFLRILKL